MRVVLFCIVFAFGKGLGMDLPYDAARITGTESPVSVWDAKRLNMIRSNPLSMPLFQTIDAMGLGSKVSQGINAVLTSVERLKANPQHRLYMLCVEKKCIGIIKVGTKKLFIRRMGSNLVEMDPLCVLDFYVHESEQRHGYGKVLFEAVLEHEKIEPRHLAIDRPSPKFLGFLKKHYRLSDYVPQSNNFVVFNQYFDEQSPGRRDVATESAKQPVSSAQGCSTRGLNASRTHDNSPPHLVASMPVRQCPTYNSSGRSTGGGGFGAAIASNVPIPPPGFQPSESYGKWGASSGRGAVGSRDINATIGSTIRRNSPTRSGASGYNIITLSDDLMGSCQGGAAGSVAHRHR